MACKTAIVLSLFFLLFSCVSNKKEYTEYTFTQTKELKGETIELDTAIFRFPFRIRQVDDKLVIMDLHGMDHYFHVFRYSSFQHLASFGERGDSPQEMLSAENIRYKDSTIWVLDANKSELTRLGFSSSGDSLLREEAVTLDKSLLRSLDFIVYNDSTFIIPDYSGDHRFCWVNRKGELMRKSGSIPTTNDDALQNARPALAQAWRSFIDYNPNNGILAAVTQLGEVLEIYDLKDTTRVVRMGPNGEPKFKVSDGYGFPTGIMGFNDVQVTDSAIYAVFHGRTFKEIAQASGSLPDGGRYIYVFSLKGEPLCKYTLDRYIYGIHVDESTKTIIATDVNNDQPIVKFTFG